MTPTPEWKWAWTILESDYRRNPECKAWQRGGPAGVTRILKKVLMGDALHDGELDVAYEIHRYYNQWCKLVGKRCLSFPMQSKRDQLIRKRRNVRRSHQAR